ncbi:MAG: response regulator [Bacteroidota bacterium]
MTEASARTYDILVVDDEAEVRSLLSDLLAAEGYAVHTAADGDDAIGVLERRAFDLILLDIKMPLIGGFEVLKFVREKHPRTRVIMLTAFAELANAMESKILGADDFVGKPFNPDELLMSIERSLKLIG